MKRRTLYTSLSIHYEGVGFTSAAVALAQHMPPPFEPVLYIPQVYGRLPARVQYSVPFPPLLPARLAFRPSVIEWARKSNERRLLRAVQRDGQGAAVWLWPGASVELQRALKASGAIIIREMINTHQGTARRILDAEYDALGLPSEHGFTEARVKEEIEQLDLSDFIVSPSESVDESLLEWNIPKERIIRSTFGWSPKDFARGSLSDLPGEGVKAIFVGQVSVRKGIHLALAAWDLAKIEGTFFIVGREDREVGPVLAPYRNRTDVRFLSFTRDLASLYRSADFMFFPTLEEGAPLVCYQAGGCGLPILTGPMGRGRLIEHEQTGLVLDPHDIEANAGALRRLAGDDTFRREVGFRVREKALKFDWTSAAATRAESFTKGLDV